MITVPVSAGAYQAVVANLQQSGGLTFHSSDGLSAGNSNNTIQLISTPLQLANGQIIAKVDTDQDTASRASIQNLVTKVMGQQSIHNEATVKPATLTITPVGSSTPATNTTSTGSVIQMVGSNGTTTRLMRSTRGHAQAEQADQPDTTESLD